MGDFNEIDAKLRDIFEFNKVKEKYSDELKELMEYIENDLVSELPTYSLSIEYFILGVLVQKKSFVYKRLYTYLTESTLIAMQDAFGNNLSTKALSAIKPGIEIKYDETFRYYIFKADEEREKTGYEKITSEHLLLAILGDDSSISKNKIRLVFNKAGLTYNTLYEKVSNEKIKSAKINDDDDEGSIRTELERKLKETILGANKNIDPNDLDIKIINGKNGEIPEDVIKNLFGLSNKKKAKGKYQNIESYCSNLNDLVEMGEIDPLVGRQNETDAIIRVLGRRKKNNVILVGGEGCGKTAIGQNIAYKIVNKEIPEFLQNKKIISLDMTALMAGTSLRGMFEERVKGVIDEIKEDGNFILFIDNIGEVMSDRGKNDYDISAMLSHSLENGDVQVIGTCDFKSYRSTFEKDPSLSRRFQKIVVDTPSVEDSIDILNGIKKYYEDFHCVKFTDEAIKNCVLLADRYITERNLPDSAIDVMDEAGAIISTQAKTSDEIKGLRKKLVEAKNSLSILKKNKDFDKIDETEAEIRKLETELIDKKNESEKFRKENPTEIDSDIIFQLISTKTGIPVTKLNSDDKKKLLSINDRLKSEVIGQDDAIDTICKALKRNRVGLSTNKCIYSALIAGKTGVGKTLVAKKLAKEMFGDEKALIRFDMSEYPDKTSVNKLIGSNPGYVGYEEGGVLTEAIKNKKHCVLLLDEIEKADPDIYNVFLQVLDEGFLTDNSGMKVDFKNVIILFTSNVGTKQASDFGKGIGFNEDVNANTKRILLKELKNKFPPEFLNRLNNVIYFNDLTNENLKEIIKIEIGKLGERLKKMNYNLSFDGKVVDYLLGIISNEKEFGARPIIRAVQTEIEDKITDLLLEKEYENGYSFNISVPNDYDSTKEDVENGQLIVK